MKRLKHAEKGNRNKPDVIGRDSGKKGPVFSQSPKHEGVTKHGSVDASADRFLLPKRELNRLIDGHFISKGNSRQAFELFSDAARIGLDFKLAEGKEKPIVSYRTQEGIMSDLLEPIPRKGKGMSELMAEVKEKIINGAVNFSSPGFIAFPDSGNSLAAVEGHLLSGFLNQNLINSVHTSPTATFVEIAVVNWLREIVGFDVTPNPKDTQDIGGISVPGGVSANTIGLLLARENRFPGTMRDGVTFEPSKVNVYIARGISHYSSRAALGWLGLGTSSMVDVDTTPDFKIDQADLVRKVEGHVSKGGVPLAVVAYAGDSRTMAIDDFEGVSKIAKRYGMWMHVDACHGLSLCFSKKLRGMVKGIELADSITIDPHKVLFTPYSLSYVLVRDQSRFSLVEGISDLITKEPFSLGRLSPFLGSKPFNSLKLWMLMKHLGTDNIGRLIEQRHGMALYFASLLAQEQEFYVMNKVMINNVAYLYVPRELKDSLAGPEKEKAIGLINKLNGNVHRRIFEEGRYYVHTFKLNDFMGIFGVGSEPVFQMQRVSIGNPLTTKEVLRDFVGYLRGVCQEEYRKLTDKGVEPG
jgi:L-2,4-diaminobutyrate decarboxylase